MSGHRRRGEFIEDAIRNDPEFQANYERARRELDAKWEVTCRYGNCTIFVDPDSSVGPDQDDGWGPIYCLCKANEDGYCSE